MNSDVVFTKCPDNKLSVVLPERLSVILDICECSLRAEPDARIYLISESDVGRRVQVGPLDGLEMAELQTMGVKFNQPEAVA